MTAPFRPVQQALLVIAGLIVTFSAFGAKPQTVPSKTENQVQEITTPTGQVKGSSTSSQSPRIMVSGGREGYSGGGMVAIPTSDEPAVYLSGYSLSGSVDVVVYKADETALLQYLIHDKEGKQKNKQLSVSDFQQLATLKHELSSGNGNESKLTLPIKEAGIYLLRITYGSHTEDSIVVRSGTGVVLKEGDNEFVFWGQDFSDRRSIRDGQIALYNLMDGVRQLGGAEFTTDGIGKLPLTPEADIAIITRNGEKSVVPINLHYLNVGYDYKQFVLKTKQLKYFMFTDRPIYRPGDTVYFKAVLRNDDDARYTIPSGSVTVKIYTGWGENEQILLEQNYPINDAGTVAGQYALSPTLKTGNYSIQVKSANQIWSSTSFDVQFFRKPEYIVELSGNTLEYVAGDQASVDVKAQYFSGQPLAGQKVQYRITSADYYEYEYVMDKSYLLNDDYRYGYWYGTQVRSGDVELDQKGEAKIVLPVQPPSAVNRSQIISVEVEYDDGSGNPSFDRKNVLMHRGTFDIYRQNTGYYTTKLGTPLTIPLQLVSFTKDPVGGIQMKAQVKREEWVRQVDPNQKYPIYTKVEENIGEVTATTDNEGNATLSLTPTKVGSYTFTVTGQDRRGNSVTKLFYSYVSAENQVFYWGQNNNDLTLLTDKKQYKPGDTVKLTLQSTTPDRDVLISFERGRMDRYFVVPLKGDTGTVDLPLVQTDMPNIYISASSFSTAALDQQSVNIPVSTETKKLVVQLTPDRSTVGPGDTLSVNVATTDTAGNPLAADLALWTVDKAIFQLADENKQTIFNTFWQERYDDTSEAHSLQGITVYNAERGGGCFVGGTQVLMSDRSTKPIESVKTGDKILTRINENDPTLVAATVTATHAQEDNGYLIINGTIKVTPNHRLWINGHWQEAAYLRAGDLLTGNDGASVMVETVEWMLDKTTVYNLTVDKYHTYFADGVWVHNQKGGGRSIFKDTAYWNPSVRTGADGRAKVTIKLPDNLTTWVIAAVGATIDTTVGQTTKEVIVTKDVIVRPILPNILREGDTSQVSALVQNFTEKEQTFDVSLNFNAGEVQQATFAGVIIPSQATQEVIWTITPKNENEKATLTFSAVSNQDKTVSDVITNSLPVKLFGFAEQRAEVGDGTKTYAVGFAADSHKQKSNVVLSLAPSLIGSLPSAIEYLLQYPYGCVEQTTSRFVPLVIAKANLELFADVTKDKPIDEMISKGLSRLNSLQKEDGGWTWWYSGKSDPFITSYVLEYLLLAQKNGLEVDSDMLSRAKYYLQRDTTGETYEQQVARTYGLALSGAENRKRLLETPDSLSSDMVAVAVMSNYLYGHKDAQTNGLATLMKRAQPQGDTVFWTAGAKDKFGSIDASTALAVRAILMAGGDREIAAKGIRYLTRSRKFQYWSNTFATAQIIRAIADFSKTGNELTPNYTYTVTLDGKELTKGTVTSSKQRIKDILIRADQIAASGGSLVIAQSGVGQLYSTALTHEFHLSKDSRSSSTGLSVSREYYSERGDEYGITVGDAVTVKITVSGLNADEYYGVIADELPAGLIPVNERLKNQQFDQTASANWYDLYDRETTENGMVMSLYKLAAGSKTYTYRARAVSSGTFSVPPVQASLMYAPEIAGRSGAETLTVTREPKVLPQRVAAKALQEAVKPDRMKQIAVLLIPIGVIVAGIAILLMKIWKIDVRQMFINKKQTTEKPPEPLHPDDRKQE